MPTSCISLPLVSLPIYPLNIWLNNGSVIHIWLCHFLALHAFCIFLLSSVYNPKTSSVIFKAVAVKTEVDIWVQKIQLIGTGIQLDEGSRGRKTLVVMLKIELVRKVLEKGTLWKCLLISLILFPTPHPPPFSAFSQNVQSLENLLPLDSSCNMVRN